MQLRILSQILLYPLLEWPLMAFEVFLRLYLLVFLKDALGISMGELSVLLFFELVIEALFARRIGKFGDIEVLKGRSRWPLVLAGALSAGLSLLLLFHLPVLTNTTSNADLGIVVKFVGLLLALIVQLSVAMAWVNYAALVGEVRRKSHSFTLIGLRGAFAALAPLLTIGVTGHFINLDEPSAFRQTTWFLCISLFLLAFLSSLSRPLFLPKLSSWAELEGPETHSAHPVPGHEHLPWSTFLLLMGAFFFQIAFVTASSSLLYYLRDFLSVNAADIEGYLVKTGLSLAVSVLIWIFIARQLRTRISLYALILLAGICLLPPMIFVYPNLVPMDVGAAQFWLLAWAPFFTAPFFLTEYLLFRLAQKAHKVGESFGLWWIPIRLGRSLGLILIGLYMGWAGLDSFDPRSADRIALLHGPLTAGVLAVALLFIAGSWYVSKRGAKI